jgi:hypothetical protein
LPSKLAIIGRKQKCSLLSCFASIIAPFKTYFLLLSPDFKIWDVGILSTEARLNGALIHELIV